MPECEKKKWSVDKDIGADGEEDTFNVSDVWHWMRTDPSPLPSCICKLHRSARTATPLTVYYEAGRSQSEPCGRVDTCTSLANPTSSQIGPDHLLTLARSPLHCIPLLLMHSSSWRAPSWCRLGDTPLQALELWHRKQFAWVVGGTEMGCAKADGSDNPTRAGRRRKGEGMEWGVLPLEGSLRGTRVK